MEGEYTGHVKDGKVHGVGVCVYTDGSRYQGDWKAGLKCGRGTHSFASGDQFEGEWENGWMHGLGVYTWKIGDKYIGEVQYGRIHGFGTYTWRTNSKCGDGSGTPSHLPRARRRAPAHSARGGPAFARRYVGQWKDGRMHGNGVKTDPHGPRAPPRPQRAAKPAPRPDAP